MLKLYTVISLLLFPSIGFAQKQLEKTFDATTIDTITIDGNGIYKINVQTAVTTSISIIATIDGETYENIVITSKPSLNEITFGVGSTPGFIPENDKLAAHKIIAIELKVLVPEDNNVTIGSDIADFEGSGVFKCLSVALSQGACTVNNFKGNGVFYSLLGDLKIQTFPEVSGTAISQYGIVENTLRKHQKFEIMAESTHGNIYLTQTK
jgi:hypothetical protein